MTDPKNPHITEPVTGLPAVYGGAEAFEGEAFEQEAFEAAEPAPSEGLPLPMDFFVG